MQIAYCNIFSIFQILAFTHKAYSYTAHTELYITYSKNRPAVLTQQNHPESQ